MIRDEHLDHAVAVGAITAEQAQRLREIARRSEPLGTPREPEPGPDEERFRLIGGFNDVFVTIGLFLLMFALFALAATFGHALVFTAAGCVLAWALSEVFARHMRLALPSIVLSVMLAYALGSLVTLLYGLVIPGAGPEIDKSIGLRLVLFGAGATLAGLLHYARFRVPIDAGVIAGSLVLVVYGAASMAAPIWTEHNGALLLGLLGLAVFAAALRIDATDPERLTRRSDIAFWLHLVAAPIIVHAIIPDYGTGPGGEIDSGWSATALIMFVGLGLVALVIDRRALLVSGLTYAGIALAYLLSNHVDKGMRLSLTLLALAVLVLGLSVGWRSLRALLLPALPLGGLRRYVPPAA
jgi:hypothetical protein